MLARAALGIVLTAGLLCLTVGVAYAASPSWANLPSGPEIAPEDSAGLNVLEPGTSVATPNRDERKVSDQERVLREWNSTSIKPPKGSPKG